MSKLVLALAALLLTVGGISAQATQSERVNELDFAPFEEALAGLTDERVAELDELIVGSTVVDLGTAMANGEVTSEELTLYFINRIQMYDDHLRSYIALNPAALDEARAADEARSNGDILGPLHGIPVNLKDNIETAGPIPTTAGAIVLMDNVAEQDAPLVSQLREGGAVILGKASLSEFAGAVSVPGANAMSGQGINPYGDAFPVAGSSSGSGISSSSYLTGVSVGTETSGSLIAPAAYNGNVGMKPSAGVVSGEGVVPLIRYNDSPGPVTRTVTDAAVLLGEIDSTDTDYLSMLDAEALSGANAAVLAEGIIAHPQEQSFTDVSENPAIVEQIEAGLQTAGAEVSETTLVRSEIIDSFFTTFLAGGVEWDMMPYVASVNPDISTTQDLVAYNNEDPAMRAPFGNGFIELGFEAPSSEDYEDMGPTLVQEAAAALDATFEASGADVLVSLENVHSQYYATAGYPAITVQLGLRENGMPAGVVLIGKPGEDAQLLAYAYAFEQANLGRVEPPIAGSGMADMSGATPEATPES